MSTPILAKEFYKILADQLGLPSADKVARCTVELDPDDIARIEVELFPSEPDAKKFDIRHFGLIELEPKAKPRPILSLKHSYQTPGDDDGK